MPGVWRIASVACAVALTVAGAAFAQLGPDTPRAAPAPSGARHAVLAGPRLILPLLATAETSAYGKLSTALEIANISDAEARYTARLLGDGGNSPLPLLVETTNSGLFPVSTVQETLPAHAGKRFVFSPREDTPAWNQLRIVWAEFTADPEASLSVSVVLRAETRDGTVSRTAIPPAPLFRRAWLHTDNADGSVTTVVLVNPSATETQTLALHYRDFASAERTCETSVTVFDLGRTVVETGESLPCSAGSRGLLEVSGPGEFAGIGLVSGTSGGILARELAGQPPERHAALSQWAVAPGQVGFGSALARGCVTLAGTQVGGTAYTVHSSKWQRRAYAGDQWTDVLGTARTGQLCPYEPSEPGEYRAVAEITVGDDRGLFASSDILTVEDGPAPPPEPIAGLEEFTNDLGMQFVKIPAGEFSMGSSGVWADDDESPVTRVRISKSFWMGKHEVTQRQWTAVMGGNPTDFGNCGDDCPVYGVSWDQAQAFVAKLNEMVGNSPYRLPTEAEWEYAARAGTDTDTYAGNLTILGWHNAPILDGIAWYGGNSGVDYDGAWDCSEWRGRQYTSSQCGPHPVGRKAPSRYGLHDMLGNVGEWVQDRYGEYPGGQLEDPSGAASGTRRVVRGCSWTTYGFECRSARRWGFTSEPYLELGFRVAMEDRADATTGGPDPAAGEYVPLDDWTVSDGRVQFFFLGAGGCISIGNTTLNGVTYTVHSSHWERRADASGAWADIPGTERTGSLCPYLPSGPGQYRGVAEISIGGERAKYSTKNVLTVGGEFQPQTVEVALGASGELVTLMTAEDGSFWIGDTLLNSGDIVAASNGNDYVLTVEDGLWTATYVLPEIVVALGTSGETVTIAKAEDGSFRIGDTLVASGETIVAASNGNEYRLTLATDGTWAATLVADAQPTFGAATVNNQTYTAGTLIAPLTLPTASGGDGALSYSLSPNVPGLTFNSATRALVGTPTAAGTYSMTYTVRDADGDLATLNFTLTVVMRVMTIVDLVVASASVTDTSPNAGQSFDLRATVVNTGTGASASTTLRFFRSANRTITARDSQVGSVAMSALSAEGTASKATTLTAPSTAGTYYYGACVDPVAGESDTSNNCSRAVTVTVMGSQMGADLSDFGLAPENRWQGSIVFANDRFYLPDEDDRKVYAYSASGQPEAAAGFDLSADNGDAKGITFANNRFFVSDEDDDKVYAYSASGQPEVAAGFDLIGDNGGAEGITFANNRFFVSDGDDRKVYAYSASGQPEAAAGFDLIADNGHPAGITFANNRFFVVDWRDDKVYAYSASGQPEAAASFDLIADNGDPAGITFANNRFFVVDWRDDKVYGYPPAVSLGTTEPDLVVGSPTVSDSSPDTGETFVLRVTVRNQGGGRSAAATLRYYRSSNARISTSDEQVGSVSVGPLAAKGSSAKSISLTAPSTAGTYYYGACVDLISSESDTSNNCSRGVRVVHARSGSAGQLSATSNLSVTAPDDDHIRLRWNAVAGADYYNIHYCYSIATPGFPCDSVFGYDKIASDITATTYLHENSRRSDRFIDYYHYYIIQPCNSSGCLSLPDSAVAP